MRNPTPVFRYGGSVLSPCKYPVHVMKGSDCSSFYKRHSAVLFLRSRVVPFSDLREITGKDIPITRTKFTALVLAVIMTFMMTPAYADNPPVSGNSSIMHYDRDRATIYVPQAYDIMNVKYIYGKS